MADDDFERLSNDPELTQEKLAAELQAYSQALREEFEAKTEKEPENVEEHIKGFFRANVHTAAAQIVWLSINAESETVKLSASKEIVRLAVAAEQDDKDPVANILAQLKSNDKKPQPANKED